MIAGAGPKNELFAVAHVAIHTAEVTHTTSGDQVLTTQKRTEEFIQQIVVQQHFATSISTLTNPGS